MAVAGLLAAVLGGTASPAEERSYSPFLEASHPDRVFFGDTHLHTLYSPDAYLFGTRLDPDAAYRFAQGEQVTATHGLPVRLVRPLDFLVVADHAEYLGLMPRLFAGDPQVLATPFGKKLHAMAQEGEEGAFEAAMEVIEGLSQNREDMKVPALAKTIWRELAGFADRHDRPGRFTAFIGYEWTSLVDGNNLHRVVIFADDAKKATRVVPFSSFDSPDPEDLWAWLAAYEEKTGGRVLAIPHNGNLSNGMMFQTKRLDGRDFDEAYAETRRRWEPLYEVTQIKGDGETHPVLSPNDEFADFGRWDSSNLGGSQAKEDWMLPTEYARSALGIGLALEAKLGVNPFRFGLIGSTDSHTGLATAREDNFWGKHSGLEPAKGRMTHALAKVGDVQVLGWQQLAGGLAAVWARENTREALFDAMQRRETYATTGTRMRVRVFGGWDFTREDLMAPDFAASGYARGVPMGGELGAAPEGKRPSFMVMALRDPDGAHLDRIQIVKGWIDAAGERREKVHDVALSNGRRPGLGGRVKAVGNTVDAENATWANSIGDAQLLGFWRDASFDPSQPSFYYVRVLEIPTPRWTAYDAHFFGVEVPEGVEAWAQERAYTSPIWYSPGS